MATLPPGFEIEQPLQPQVQPAQQPIAPQPTPQVQPTAAATLPEGFIIESQPTQQEVGLDVVDTGIPSDRALPLGGIPPVEPTVGEEIVGGLDVAARIVSGAAAEVGAGVAGLVSLPFVGLDQAVKNIETVRDFITLDADTELGQRNLKVVGNLVGKGVDLVNFPISGLIGIGEILAGQGIEQAAKSVEAVQREGPSTVLGERVLEETGSPALATIAHSLPTAALERLGLTGLKSTRLSGEKLSGNIAEAITQAAPDLQTIKKRASDAYDELDNLGVKVRPIVFEQFANKLSARLDREGIDPTLHPKSTAALKRITDDIGQAKTATELNTLRKIAQGAASSIDPPDARLGNIIIREIDSGLDALSEQIGGKFKEARALSQRAFKSQAITDMIENASHTASGLENGLRIEVRKLLKNKKKRRGFTKDELNTLREIEQGTTAANVAKFLGKFGISEGQATSMLGASIGIGGGGAIGSVFGPGGAAVGAITVPALGQLAKKTAQRITLNNTKFADDLFRAGKDAKEITKAYLKNTPIADRNISDLTDLFLEANLKPANIRGLPSSKSASGKLALDAVHFANEIKRRAQQAGAAALITTPPIGEQQ